MKWAKQKSDSAIAARDSFTNPHNVGYSANRSFFLFLLLSIILLFVPETVKLRLLAFPRAILLAPLNIALRVFSEASNLRQENSRLAALATRLQIENAYLKEHLQQKSGELVLPDVTLLKAQIVGRDREAMVCYLLLNKGETSGIKINMPVITELGIVGKVIQTSPLQSLVETILSKDSKIAALDQRSRVTGVVTFNSANRLRLNYIIPEADVQVGDTIVSSGLGGVFPKGLLIGTVIKVDNPPAAKGSELFKDILLKPCVNIYALEVVYVIVGGVKPEPPEIKTINKKSKADFEKTLKQFKIEPPIEIKIR